MFLTIHDLVAQGSWSSGWQPVLIWFVINQYSVYLIMHRYFSHRAFATSRGFQFAMALYGVTLGQNDVLWWAYAHHRHHRYCDTPLDPHSAQHRGVWYAAFGWIWHTPSAHHPSERDRGRSFREEWARFPELYWVCRFGWIVTLYRAAWTLYAGGLDGLIYHYLVPIALSTLVTLISNVALHLDTTSKTCKAASSAAINCIQMFSGEAWHDVHHQKPRSACTSDSRWYTFDGVYTCCIRPLRAVGLIWDVIT